MLYLRAFGGLALENGGRPIVGATAQRARLAMLVVLAASADRGISRDRLLALFWPEKDTDHARAALRQALYSLRRDAGEPELILGTNELALNRAVIGGDVLDFDIALNARDFASAVALYAGPLLDGVHLADVPELERWIESERERRAQQYRMALEHLATSTGATGDQRAAAALWRKLAASDPLSPAVAVSVMQALVRIGEPSAAIQHARAYERLVRAELDAAPDQSVVRLAHEIRLGLQEEMDPSAAPVRGVMDPVRAHGERQSDRSYQEPNESSLEPSSALHAEELTPAPARRVRSWRLVAAGGGLSLVAWAIMAGGSVWRRGRLVSNAEGAMVRRSDIVLPDSAPLASVRDAPVGRGRKIAISADGRRLVYVAQRGATTQLYLRELDRLDAMPLIGTDGAYQPFFSPDGEWIAFFAERDLKKVPVNGGPATTLASLSEPHRGAWTHDGRILVVEKQGERLSWVPSTGGAAQRSAKQLSVRAVDMELVAADKWILHTTQDGILFLSSLESGQTYAITLDGAAPPDSVDVSRLLHGSNPRYLECGHIAYSSADGVLMALPFDLGRRKALGPPAPVQQGIRVEAPNGTTQLTISRNGTLVYAPGSNARASVIVWFDYVTGRLDTLPFPQAAYRSLTLSPDGHRILTQVDATTGMVEWRVLDIDRGTQMVVPTGLKPGVKLAPYWSPDGASILFAEYTSPRSAPPRGVRQSLVNPADRVTMSRVGIPSPDGRHLALLPLAAGAITQNVNASSQPDSERGVWFASIDGSEPDRKIAGGEIAFPTFSPDGAWIAYTDRSAGRSEVYVTRVANPGQRTKITAQRGDVSRWTDDGKMIIYVDGQEWYGVDVSTKKGFVAGRPRLLFRGPFQQPAGWSYDVSRDGRRLLLMLGPPDETTNDLVVVTNWFAEVGRLAPAARR